MKSRALNNQKGIALLMALLTLLLLSAIAAGLIFSTNTDSAINSNFRAEQREYFAARAGLEEARIRMLVPKPGGPTPAGTGDLAAAAYVPTLPPGTNGGAFTASDMIYITNPNATDAAGAGVKPWDPANPYWDNELCHEYLPNPPYPAGTIPDPGTKCATTTAPGVGNIYYTQVASLDPNTGTSAAMDYKWVRIMAKQNATVNAYTVDAQRASQTPMPTVPPNANTQVCWTGGAEVLKTTATCGLMPSLFGGGNNIIYQLTSFASNSTGARRMEQMEIAYDPPINLNSAVSSHGQVTMNGSLTVSGYDSCQCSCTGQTDPGAADNKATSCTPVPGYAGTCSTNGNGTLAVFGDSGTPPVDPHGSSGVVSGPVGGYNTTTSTWVYDVSSIVSELSTMPGVVNAPTGTRTNVQYPVLPSGAFSCPVGSTCPPSPAYDASKMIDQITYVNGDTHLAGGGQGSGILLVNGNLAIDSGFQFYGLIIVTGNVSFSGGGSTPTNIFGGILAGQSTTDTTTLGGSVNISYDSCAEKFTQSTQPPKVLSAREISY